MLGTLLKQHLPTLRKEGADADDDQTCFRARSVHVREPSLIYVLLYRDGTMLAKLKSLEESVV
jgi:hypothetical protein